MALNRRSLGVDRTAPAGAQRGAGRNTIALGGTQPQGSPGVAPAAATTIQPPSGGLVQGGELGPSTGPRGNRQLFSGPTQQFGPGSNLISTQFNPVASGRLQGIQGQVDTALGALTGPDRGELASQAFSRIQEASAPRFQSELRDVGRRAAALGRIGSGVTTSELGDVQVTRERDLDLLRRGLATDAAGRQLDDRFRTLGATEGVADRLFGQERSSRGELRGERGFQTALDQQGIQNRVQQRQLEESLLQGQFGRDFSQQQLFAGIGFGGGATQNFGNQAGRFAQSQGNQANLSNEAAAGLFRSGAFRGGGGTQFQFPQPTRRTGLGDFTERRAPDFDPRR